MLAMRRRPLPSIVVALAVLAPAAPSAAAAHPPGATAAASTQSCGDVVVQFEPEGSGGAMNVRARGIDCTKARNVAKRCIQGTVSSGWTVVTDVRTLMTKGGKRIVYTPVGGGGCGAFQQSCGDFGYRGVGFFGMHVLGPSCAKGRRLARAWYDAGGSCRFGSACAVGGYRCRGNPVTATVTCRRENGYKVTWQMGE